MAPPAAVVSFFVELNVLVVILVSVEKGAGAAGRAEAPSEGSVAAVGAEVSPADGALFEADLLLVDAADDTRTFLDGGHGSLAKYPSRLPA
jgi:hypothetical protein